MLVDTSAGKRFVKLRGAAQGTGALVAEMIVAELAEALNLPVLPRSLATLEPDTPVDDKNDELADLLAASVGLNLTFPMLEGAHDATAEDLLRLTPAERAAVLWLDRFVMNPDRTGTNPNILAHNGCLYLIDHGAALRFQYNWSAVSEATPRAIGATGEPHIFETIAKSPEWAEWEGAFAQKITRATLHKAVASVPASFLVPLLPNALQSAPPTLRDDALARRRAAYVAFLWKRLTPPRDFAGMLVRVA